MRFKNQVAIVTGTASGMGLLSAQELAREGGPIGSGHAGPLAGMTTDRRAFRYCPSGSPLVGTTYPPSPSSFHA